ncbi:MAG: PilZ domain-containing protein, partial [Candidatus Binatia bacterium]
SIRRTWPAHFKNPMSQLVCPKCSREYVRRVARQGVKERLLSAFYIYPVGCQICRHRFHVFQRGVRYTRVEEDRRDYDRMAMSFPLSYIGDKIDGSGTVIDISINGCSLYASNELAEGSIIRLALKVSNELPPVEVEAAIVRTAQKNRVGIEFLRVQPNQRERLQLFIRGLLLGGKV